MNEEPVTQTDLGNIAGKFKEHEDSLAKAHTRGDELKAEVQSLDSEVADLNTRTSDTDAELERCNDRVDRIMRRMATRRRARLVEGIILAAVSAAFLAIALKMVL